MSLRAIALVALVGAPAAFASGLWRGENAPPVADTVQPRNVAPLVEKPGWGVSDAAGYLAKLNAPPPPPAPVVYVPPPPPPPPPPPDIALLFRRELTAVLAEPGAQPRVVLTSAGDLSPGDVYRDGWVLSSLTSTTAVLTNGQEQRRIGLFSPPPAAQDPVQVAAAPTPGPAPQLDFANGFQRGELSGGQRAGVLTALRNAGIDERRMQQIQAQLDSGQANSQSVLRLVQQAVSEGNFDPGRLSALLNVLSNAGLIEPPQAVQLTQLVARMGQQRQQAAQGGQGGRGAAQAVPAPPTTIQALPAPRVP